MKRLALILLVLGAGVLWWSGVADRLVHPARHRISGSGVAPLDAYAAAAAAALGPAERIARLTLPAGNGPAGDGTASDGPAGDEPVVAEADTGSRVYLDPPTARVLDVARSGAVPPAGVPRPLARPALTPAAAVLAARPLARGAALATLDWPGERNPDWTVRFAGRQASATVKVADDMGTATPARGRAAPIAARDVPALVAAGGVLALAIAAALAIARRARAARPARTRRKR